MKKRDARLRTWIRIVSIISLAAFAGAEAQAAVVSSTITYQGSLKLSGVPANGTYTIELDVTDSSGTVCWQGTPQAVTATEGLYRMDISPVFDNCPNSDLYIRTKINGNTLSPSEKITSAPFALIARSLTAGATAPCALTAQSLTPGATAQGDFQINGRLSATGSVGVGTTAASYSNLIVSSGTTRLDVKSTSSTGSSTAYLTSDVGGGAGMLLRSYGSTYSGSDNGHPLAGTAQLLTDGAVNGFIMDVSKSAGFLSLGVGGTEALGLGGGKITMTPAGLSTALGITVDGSNFTVRPADNSWWLGTASNRWGFVYAAGGVYVTSSSQYKRDIEPISYTEVPPGIRYRWKDKEGQPDDRAYLGFEADSLPDEAFGLDADGKPDRRAVSTNAVIGILCDAVRKLQAQNADLATRLTRLEQQEGR